ncbi:putative leucine-rich repeat receptor-like protein kinase [Planoprotostelium fungivorum]|uniref:Putative leucine-rich repeat receptor-like protein kinase n=1 Tax=Planoprotostelium fungivorum TaxID=1890364 RepID=A0A2P6MN16_9EUKA|nr:putative leucine-rich repeat receptor-like protein kinase [Planoprotostelium fungivorum]
MNCSHGPEGKNLDLRDTMAIYVRGQQRSNEEGSMRTIWWRFTVIVFCLHLCLSAELDVLRDLHQLSGGYYWKNNTGWLSEVVCSFYGIECDLEGHITKIDLSSNNLNGTITPHLGELNHLVHLDLSVNNLTGVIPHSAKRLHRLQTLKIYDNQLSEDLHEDLFDEMKELSLISLWRNRITGTIPSRILNISSLTHLDLRQNILEGELPECHSSINMSWLRLDDNKFTGVIPRSYSRMKGLIYLTLGANRMTGTLDGIFHDMSSLTHLDVGHNFFYGPIPDEFYETKLNILRLSGNQMTGTLPQSILQCKTIVELRINRNRLNGQLPSGIDGMINLRLFWLYGNDFSGPFPETIGNLSHLIVLMALQNRFNGSIPASLGRLNKLQILYLSDNRFVGQIPPELGNLTNLRHIILSQNYYLTGGVPLSFRNLKKIKLLNVNNCPKLSGTLDFLEGLTELEEFQGGFSHFHGSIPSSVSLMKHLKTFGAAGNSLTGSIPDFHPMANLSSLDLFNNRLSGLIPHEFGIDLRYLKLSHNHLGGFIRKEWTKYKNLATLELDNNNIGSSGPGYYDNNLSILHHLQKLQRFDVSNNPLGGELLVDTFDYLDEIQELRLSGCNLGGVVEVSYGGSAMPQLKVIDLSNNRFIRQLPFWLGGCKNVVYANMSHNRFTELSVSFAMMKNIQVLDLSHNSISGCLTNSVGMWPYMRELFLDNNRLTGSIPMEIGNLTRLMKLGLSQNDLTADSLEFLSSMNDLNTLDLSHNRISAVMPEGIGHYLSSLDLSHNFIYGSVPPSFFSLRYLTNIQLSHNRLNGTISSLASDPKVLDLSHNDFEGDVNFVSHLLSISILRLSNNRFAGQLPSLFNRKKLIEVDISNNRIDGQLPDFSGLPHLQRLNVSHNALTDRIPSFEGNVKMKVLDISHNNISHARQFSLPEDVTCTSEGNPLRCPISWDYITRCNSTCVAMGDQSVQQIIYHTDMDYSLFDHSLFLRSLSQLGNITQTRLNVNSTRRGSVIATIDVYPGTEGSMNEGSVEDTVAILKEITREEYETVGILLLAPVGEIAMDLDADARHLSIKHIFFGVMGGISFCIIVIAIFLPKYLKRRAAMSQYAMVDITQLNTATIKKSIIDFDELKDMEHIGSGAFGIVYRGQWRDTQVAVKQIRAEFVTQRQLKDFLHEVSILQGLKSHPNIVTFVGMTFPPQPLSLITEFCAGGSLYTYLRRNYCSLEDKLKFIGEIALGMLHLHKEKIIHRDLAVRNILLNKHLEAKVADFGLSREQENTDEASQTQSKVGPLKWMSPEAIRSREYSTKSDVFSFGVVIWEIFEPWAECSAVDAAIRVVHKDERLSIPDDCPLLIAEIMERCWLADRMQRPEFEEIRSILRAQMEMETAREAQTEDTALRDEGYAHEEELPEPYVHGTVGEYEEGEGEYDTELVEEEVLSDDAIRTICDQNLKRRAPWTPADVSSYHNNGSSYEAENRPYPPTFHLVRLTHRALKGEIKSDRRSKSVFREVQPSEAGQGRSIMMSARLRLEEKTQRGHRKTMEQPRIDQLSASVGPQKKILNSWQSPDDFIKKSTALYLTISRNSCNLTTTPQLRASLRVEQHHQNKPIHYSKTTPIAINNITTKINQEASSPPRSPHASSNVALLKTISDSDADRLRLQDGSSDPNFFESLRPSEVQNSPKLKRYSRIQSFMTKGSIFNNSRTNMPTGVQAFQMKMTASDLRAARKSITASTSAQILMRRRSRKDMSSVTRSGEVQLDDLGRVKNCNSEDAFNYLLNEPYCTLQEPEYVDSFLYGYRYHMTAKEVFRQLLNGWNGTGSRFWVAQIVSLWVRMISTDFQFGLRGAPDETNELANQLLAFLNEPDGQDYKTAIQAEVDVILKRNQSHYPEYISEKISMFNFLHGISCHIGKKNERPKSLLAKAKSKLTNSKDDSLEKSDKNLDLLGNKMDVLAQQITLWEHRTFCSIKMDELISKRWDSPDDRASPNVKQYIDNFNKVTFWVGSVIVSATDISKRVKILGKLIRLASKCLEMNNFNTSMELYLGINAREISRLTKTWEYKQAYATLEKALDLDMNHQNLRNVQMRTELPMNPYFALSLKDLTVVEEVHESRIEGRINLEKLRIITPILRDIHYQQTVPYDIREDITMQLKLDEMEVLDSSERWKKSLECEPSQRQASP